MHEDDEARMAQFDEELAAADMKGQWQFDRLLEGLVGGPLPAGVPYLWAWKDVDEKLRKACEVLPESFTARRNLAFMNPGLERGTTHTMVMGLQRLKPGEDAWSHRHTMGAIRFVIEGGTDLVTVVDGEALPMEDNDLILTPRWTWHDHHNSTDGNVTWFDALDIGLVLSLNAGFYETLGEQRQAVRTPGASLVTRAGGVRPAWEQAKQQHLPHRYAWSDVEPTLLAMATEDGSPYDGIVLEYVNPITGGRTLPTITCWIQMLRPGEATKPHRQTSSGMYHVVRGGGTTTVDGVDLEWTDHDSFVIPGWAEHSFLNRSTAEEAILFSVHDIPALEAVGLYYETPELSLGATPWPGVPADALRGA